MTLSHSGHVCLGDGTVLRLDLECGHWVASMYRPNCTLRAYAWGGLEAMSAQIDVWAAAYAASVASPAVVMGDRSAQVPAPCADQLLGGAA